VEGHDFVVREDPGEPLSEEQAPEACPECPRCESTLGGEPQDGNNTQRVCCEARGPEESSCLLVPGGFDDERDHECDADCDRVTAS